MDYEISHKMDINQSVRNVCSHCAQSGLFVNVFVHSGLLFASDGKDVIAYATVGDKYENGAYSIERVGYNINLIYCPDTPIPPIDSVFSETMKKMTLKNTIHIDKAVDFVQLAAALYKDFDVFLDPAIFGESVPAGTEIIYGVAYKQRVFINFPTYSILTYFSKVDPCYTSGIYEEN